MTENLEHPLTLSDAPAPKHHLAHKVSAGMWGKAEIITVGISVLAVVATIVTFFVMVVPARKKLADAKNEQGVLEQQVLSAREKYGKITTTEEQVARLVQSAGNFEASYLPVDSLGRTALFERLNTLIGKHGLINTSGPEYSALEIADGNAPKNEGERGREKYRSIFPGVYVTMTVEGTYADIRRFISDIETGDQFVIISAVGLEPSEGEAKAGSDAAQFDGAGGPTPGSQRRVRRGDTVSLKIELAAYFRRQNAQVQQ